MKTSADYNKTKFTINNNFDFSFHVIYVILFNKFSLNQFIINSIYGKF